MGNHRTRIGKAPALHEMLRRWEINNPGQDKRKEVQ